MTQTVNDFMVWAEAELGDAEIDEPRFEARYILGHVCKFETQIIVAYPEKELSSDQYEMAVAYVKRRKSNEPLAHILGFREFWSSKFKVTKETLIPRPDSETLIETTLDYFPNRKQSLSVLDLGVGSGCLLLSVLNEFTNANGIGVDISHGALDIAKENAQNLNLSNRCDFLISHWGEKLEKSYDLILANPPYIAEDERLVMGREVIDYEPVSALFAPENGLIHYRNITSDLKRLLTEDGLCLFEIGYKQADAVSQIIIDEGLKVLEVRKDLGGNDRVIVTKR